MNGKCRDVNILNTPVKPVQLCGLWTTVQGVLVRSAAAVSGTLRGKRQLSTPPLRALSIVFYIAASAFTAAAVFSRLRVHCTLRAVFVASGSLRCLPPNSMQEV